MRKSERKKYAIGYMKAKTSKGGDGYEKYEEYDNEFCEWCFDEWIKEQQRFTGTLYRGQRIGEEWFKNLDYNIGKVITPSDIYNHSYPSFTESEMRAVLYINDYDVFDDKPISILYNVECNGKYAVNIKEHSYYPEENEHLFVKESNFEITDIKYLGSYVRVYMKEI